MKAGTTVMLAVLLLAIAEPVRAQESRLAVFGVAGGANIGAGDSEVGSTLLWGGGTAIRVASRFAVELDATTASFDPDRFGRRFRTAIVTGSALYVSGGDSVRLAAGGGLAAWIQRTRVEVSIDPSAMSPGFCQDQPGSTCREIRPGVFEFRGARTIRMLHGRTGVRWDVTPRAQFRVDGVLWFGEGISWSAGAMTGLAYRF